MHAQDPAQIAAALGLKEYLTVRSLDLEGQGVAHRADGKVVFIDGALPYEVVSARIHRSKSSFDKGTLTELHRESSQRVVPLCPHFGLHEGACGGCKMQHFHAGAQAAFYCGARHLTKHGADSRAGGSESLESRTGGA
jgi:23S rRNA (uracil1939-C5)-methyltransferase